MSPYLLKEYQVNQEQDEHEASTSQLGAQNRECPPYLVVGCESMCEEGLQKRANDPPGGHKWEPREVASFCTGRLADITNHRSRRNPNRRTHDSSKRPDQGATHEAIAESHHHTRYSHPEHPYECNRPPTMLVPKAAPVKAFLSLSEFPREKNPPRQLWSDSPAMEPSANTVSTKPVQ